MARKIKKAYTDIGKRIAALARTQVGIARALGVSCQTVSKKLRGECVIFLSDLRTLSKSFKVPMSYFLADEKPDPKIEAILKHIRSEGWPMRHLMVLARKLSINDHVPARSSSGNS